jgi:tetratricopeptide (TPR) repeat protein
LSAAQGRYSGAAGIENLKLLLDHGANINIRSVGITPPCTQADAGLFYPDPGSTPLIVAVRLGNPAKVKLLVERGTNIEAKDSTGHTALAWAYSPYSNGVKEVVQLLEERSAQKAVPDEARQLFVQAAALIKESSSPTELDKPIGMLNTALEIAPWWGNARYNLSRAYELRGRYDDALKQINLYLETKPPEAEASEARTRLVTIQAKKEAAARKEREQESIAAVRYVSGRASRLHYTDTPASWNIGSRPCPSCADWVYVINSTYAYTVPEERPFYANIFRMPNNHLLVVMLNAESNNGAYTGDQIAVWDKTNDSCREGWSHFAFGSQESFNACGFRYDVSVTSPPNATVTVKYGPSASVTLPVALLYRGRALKAGWGNAVQYGMEIKELQFDDNVIRATEDPNVNATGLTPRSVIPYQGK